MPEWQPIETAPTNGQPNPAALLSAMQILPLADACALVAMSPEHRAAPVGAGAWKVGWGGTIEEPCWMIRILQVMQDIRLIEEVRNAVHIRNNPAQG